MGKNKLSSRQFKHVQVKSVHKRPSKHRKTKTAPWDNNKSHLKVYPENISDSPTWLTGNSDVTNATIFTKNNTIVNADSLIYNDNSRLNQSKIHNSTNELIVLNESKNNSPTRKSFNQSIQINLKCKNILMGFGVFLLGLFVSAALIVPNVLLYLMLPVIFQTPVNQTINATEPIKYANHCGDVSPYTKWIYYTSSSAIYMVVDTTNCTFNSTPLYYTSIIGNNTNSDLIGYNSIYVASSTSFVIYLRSYIGWTSGQLLNTSQIEKWNLTWIGIIF